MALANLARSIDIRGGTTSSSADCTVLRVAIQVTNLSGERYWAYDTPLPAQVQIAVNINIVGLDQKTESTVEAPFVFTVSYTPSIAQLSVKGKAQVTGDRSEVVQMTEEHKKNRPPPQTVIQAVSNIAMAEVIIMSKSLGIPPPLPPIGLPSETSPTQPIQRKEPRYTTSDFQKQTVSNKLERCHPSNKLDDFTSYQFMRLTRNSSNAKIPASLVI